MSKKIEQTKGFLSLRGEIYGLSKEPFETGSKKTLNLTIKTTEGKRVPVKLGNWSNSQLKVKYKCEGMDSAVDVLESDAIDEIKDVFSDGDSVFVSCRVDVNTYKDGSLDFYVNKIFIAKEKIDFNASDFKEVNALETTAIISEAPEKGVQKVMFATYRGETLERELIINDGDIQAYFDECNVGDEVKIVLNVTKEPIYDESQKSDNKETKVKKTLKGGVQTTGGGKGKIIGTLDILTVEDVVLDSEVKGKYTMLDLKGEAPDDMPF